MAEKVITMPSDNPIIPELDLLEPPEELLEYAKRELEEDPETRCQVISDFRDLIYERGECMPHRMDDDFLLRFLRARLFVVRHAHRLLVNYCDFKENNPQFFENVDITNLKTAGDLGIISVPPYREQTGRRMLILRVASWNPEEFTIIELFQATILILEIAVLEQRGQILGGICVFDLEGLSMQHVWQFTPTVVKQMFDIMVTSFPLRIHSVHIINQSWMFDILYNLFKPWLSELMRERLFLHGENMESLQHHIDSKYLSERYGGLHPDYNYNDWIDYCGRNEKVRADIESLGYNLEFSRK